MGVAGNPAVYRIAGGSPIYVSSWGAVGGGRPVTWMSQSQFDSLPSYPADGTFLNGSGGTVYRVAGGAPIGVSDWSTVGGPQSYTTVDQFSIDHPELPISHLRQFPADGTLISTSGDGRVYTIAGGAPLYVSSWDSIGGARPAVGVDRWAVENPSNPAAHLRRFPQDSTYLASSSGAVYIVAGGAPMFLSNWNHVGGAHPYTRVDQWAIDTTSGPFAHLRNYPANGTFLNSTTGHVYRIAGGAPFALSAWSLFGGMRHYTTVDEWDFRHRRSPAAHLRVTPADGTIVKGLPSRRYWAFHRGHRSRTNSRSRATTVDDFGIKHFSP